MSGRLAGLTALVTGGASGIGAAAARRFLHEGASVIVADLQLDAGTEFAREAGDACRFVRTDVSVETDVAGAVDLAVETFGQLDIIFNNAGIIGAVGPIAKTRMADVDQTFAVILNGTMHGMKHAARVMMPRRRGVILSTTSPGGMVGGHGPHAYSGAKAGVIGLSQSVAAELRPHGIRVNTIAPGAIVTAMTADLVVGDASDLSAAEGVLAQDALMGRPGMPEDIAAAAAFLASDDASFITGANLTVDAGMTTAGGASPFASGDFEEPGGILEAGRRSPSS